MRQRRKEVKLCRTRLWDWDNSAVKHTIIRLRHAQLITLVSGQVHDAAHSQFEYLDYDNRDLGNENPYDHKHTVVFYWVGEIREHKLHVARPLETEYPKSL